MGKVYSCDNCNREFIIDNEDISPNPRIKVPTCPYCGKKEKGSLSNYKLAIHYVSDND